MNGSISLLRANPALTTNVKIVVDSSYNLYLESYSANLELSNKKYKKYLINSDVFISERIASFYKNLPSDIAFDVKNDIKSDTIQNTYLNQYDDIYYSGPRNVEDTRYIEEFQYNTTLKIDPNNLPKYFFIFRVDDPGVYDLNTSNISDYFNDLKVIQAYDLSSKTSIGKLWNKNYIEDDKIPRSSVELNFKKFEFSQWNGYDYKTGGSVSKSFFIDDFVTQQNNDFNFEKFITDGFQKNGVVSANYTNFSYLFDDTVSDIFYESNGGINKYYEDEFPIIHKLIKDGYITENQYVKASEISGNTFRIYYTFTEHIPYRKKWTINRYTGFYADDLISINKISTYQHVKFKLGESIDIVDNVFKIGTENVNPVFGSYNNELPIYFKIGNQFYLIEKNSNNEYLIITENKINGTLDEFVSKAQKPVKLVYETDGTNYHTYIKNSDNTYFNDLNLQYYMNNNSVAMIKILDKYYKLKKDVTGYYLNTDEYIICDSNILTQQLGNNNKNITSVQILTKDNNIVYFEIFIFKFTHISDWDYNRVDTKFASIEYDRNDEISYNRPFVYMTDINDVALPKEPSHEKYYSIWLRKYPSLTDTLLTPSTFILPMASEYAANGDLYMFNDSNTLTNIWDINQSIPKWGLTNSINSNASQYKINNSLVTAGTYNFTPNMYNTNISINDMNLDWFYTIGKPVNYTLDDFDTLLYYTNFKINNIVNRTLHIDLPVYSYDGLNTINEIYKIDLNYYKNTNAVIDYFDYIFNTPAIYNDTLSNNLINNDKVAFLNESDNVNGPEFFFKGIKGYLKWVDLIDPNDVTDFNTKPANDLSGYGFSILFNGRETEDITLYGKAGIEIILNKKYKNILINIYIYTPLGQYTSLDFRERDKLYNEQFVKYTKYDSLTGTTKWVDSELHIQALTLANFVNLIESNILKNDIFSQGIKYTIVEDKTYYEITNIELDNTNNTIVHITFLNDIKFKHGDWIYLQNSGIAEYDKNLQISNRINNKKISIRFNNDQTANVTALLLILNDILISDKQDIIPFKISFSEPDEIKINTKNNILIGDTTSPVKPINSSKLNKNIIVKDNSVEGLIPHVYVDDNISRRIFRNNDIGDLSYSEIESLPSIYRFSGDYEPILNNIDLFNKTKLKLYFVLEAKYMTFNGNTLEIHFDALKPDIMTENDIFYILQNTAYSFLQYKTGHIINIDTSTIPGMTFKITLNFEYNIAPIITDQDLIAMGNIFNIAFCKQVNKNTGFNFDYQYFGINKNIINAKVYDGVNPLQTSNNINKVSNEYPMIDEHGVMNINRNIFKSSWDLKYYYRTQNNKYEIK